MSGAQSDRSRARRNCPERSSAALLLGPGIAVQRHNVRPLRRLPGVRLPGFRLRLGAEAIEALHGGFVDALVEVSVDVEDGSGALVSEPVGDVPGGLVLGDQHRHVGVAQVMWCARWADGGFDGGVPVSPPESVVVERPALGVGEHEVRSGRGTERCESQALRRGMPVCR